MGKTPTNHHVRIPCGLCATAKCQGDAGRRWIYGQTVAKDDSCSLGLGASSGRRRRERGGLALGIIRGAREAVAASTSARRAASACSSAAVAARFHDLTSSRAASSSAARRSLVAWAAAASIIVPKNGCARTVACRLSFCAAAAAAAALLSALSAMHLACFSSISCSSEWMHSSSVVLWTATSAAAQSAGNRSRCAIPRVRQSVDVDDRNAGRHASRASFNSSSLFAEVMLETMCCRRSSSSKATVTRPVRELAAGTFRALSRRRISLTSCDFFTGSQRSAEKGRRAI